MIVRFVIIFFLIIFVLGMSLFFIPIDTFLKRAINTTGVSYSVAEGNIFKGKINNITYAGESNSPPLELGNYHYNGRLTFTGFKVSFANEDKSTSGQIKTNVFNGGIKLQEFTTSTSYRTNGLGFMDINISIDDFLYKNGRCEAIKGYISLSNDSFDEKVGGNVNCLPEGVFKVQLFISDNVDMGTMIYKPGFIDLEIETAILKPDVEVFLGKRMGFTIPL